MTSPINDSIKRVYTPNTVQAQQHTQAAVGALKDALECLEKINDELVRGPWTLETRLTQHMALIADLATINAALLVLAQTPLSKPKAIV